MISSRDYLFGEGFDTASVARKKVTIRKMYAALPTMGHEKLWFYLPIAKGRKSGVCHIVT